MSGWGHITADGRGVVAVVRDSNGGMSQRGRTDVVLSLSSEIMVVPAAVASVNGATSLLKDEVLSLSLETMVVPAAVASADGATSLLTAAVLSQSSEAVLTATAATVS